MKRRGMVAALAIAVVVLVVIGVVRFRSRTTPAPPSTAETAADASGTVKFLMEQQWAIRMKLAKAEPAVCPADRHAGRLSPAQAVTRPWRRRRRPHHQRALPRVGQAVARGIQCDTAARPFGGGVGPDRDRPDRGAPAGRRAPPRDADHRRDRDPRHTRTAGARPGATALRGQSRRPAAARGGGDRAEDR